MVGREKNQVVSYADVPVEQRPSWQAYITQEPFNIRDWKTDERIPARLKDGVASLGLDVGPLVFVPLTSPVRPLGALGMAGPPGAVYTDDDIAFLRLVGRIVAFAIDDNFNRQQAETASEGARAADRARYNGARQYVGSDRPGTQSCGGKRDPRSFLGECMGRRPFRRGGESDKAQSPDHRGTIFRGVRVFSGDFREGGRI